MAFLPSKNKDTGINVSNIYSMPAIYIGDEFNQTVVSFKPFLETLTYDFSKETETNNDTEKGSSSFKTKSGLVSIKLGFSVVASSLSEAKNNLAKISHLQRSIRMQLAAGSLDGHKNRHTVYLSNLINNGYAAKWIKVDENTVYTGLRQAAFACAIDEVDYKPDTKAGFLQGSDGLYPKSFSVSLTLNPDMEKHYVPDKPRTFIRPFNFNGQYSNSDFGSFPFLVKVGDFSREATTLKSLFGGSFDYSISAINQSSLNFGGSKSKIFISMPIGFDDLNPLPDQDNGVLAEDPKANIMRYVTFKPFLEDFSRKFSTTTDMYKDPNGSLDQKIQGVATNKAVEYKISFSVPCGSLTEAIHNAAKMQILMRMFFKKKKLGSNGQAPEAKAKPAKKNREEQEKEKSKEKPKTPKPENDTTANSLVVYVGGILQKGGTDYGHTSDIEELYKRGMYLQVSDLTIDVDVKSGFFQSSGKFYPKSYKVDMSFVDTHQENYYKQKTDGSYEGTFPPNAEWDNRYGNDDNRQSMLSRTTYWKVGGNPR